MIHILDSIKLDELTEEWYYPENTLIRIRKVKDTIEFAQIGYHNVDEYYKE